MTRNASILAVGSELLGTTRLDTNSLFLTGELEAIGFRVVRKACVRDGWDDLLAELSFALSRAPLLCVTGGLGPTEDDRTKEAVAALLGRRLVRDGEILERLRERFRKRGREMPEVNAKQADVVEGAVVLPNRRGTAPGYLIETDGKTIVLLPGVPWEMKALFTESVVPHLTGGDAGRSPPPRPEGRRAGRERRRGARPPGLRGAPGSRGHDPGVGAGRGPAPLRRARDARTGAEGARRPGVRLPVGGRFSPLRT
ncbi:MAG: competence/damage-inducible protein A [Holophagales bacterium]|nr:competence/damage-inducible protein A [Holophagales bacterium]